MVELLFYLFYFVSSTGSTLQRRELATRRTNDTGQIDFAFRVMTMTFFLSFVLIFFNHPYLNQSLFTILTLATICGVFGAVAIGSQYVAQRHVEAGITSLAGNIYTPVTIVLGTLLLHEHLKPRQAVGAVILLVAVVLVSNKHRISRWRFDRYLWLMILCGVTLAFVLTAERSLIKNNGIASGTWISWGAQSLSLGIAAIIAKTRSQYNFKDTMYTGSLRFLQQLSWVVLVTVVANISLVSAVTTFKIVLVFITGAIFLKERKDLKRKIIGSLIATFGLLLMI